MILKRLKCHNYRQHADIDKSLDGTLIAVVGPNGSGKSNLLGAIQFAFTGEQTGFKKSDLLRWGQQEGEVVVDFEHNGKQCTISRSLHSSGATLKYGEESFRGATAVTDALRLHLELDKDLLKQAVFVRQAEIDSILFTDPRARELSFQRLMGIGDAAKIHKVLGEALSEMADMPNYDEQIADGKRRYAELHERLGQLQQQVTSMKASRAQIPQMETIRAQMACRTAQINALNKVQDTCQDAVAQERATAWALTALEAVPKAEGDIASYDLQIAQLQQRSTQAGLYIDAYQQWASAGQAVLALGNQQYAPEQLQAARAEYDKLTAEINQLLGKHKFHKDLLGVVANTTVGAECPVCGSALKDSEWIRNRLTRIMQTLETNGTTLRAQQVQTQTVLSTMQAEIDRFQRQYTSLTAQYGQADKRLRSLKETTDDPAVLRDEIEKLTVARRHLINTMTARTSAESSYTAQQKQADVMQQRYRAAQDAARTLGIDSNLLIQQDLKAVIQKLQEEHKGWEEQQVVLQQIDTELARLEGTVQELATTMTTLDKTVAGLEYKRGTQQTYKDAVAVLTRTRDWFHYANGPHTLSTSVLGVMNQEVNRFLANFTAPFTVEPSSDSLGFRCHFTDGRAMPQDGDPDASVLSGGQKIQLAVAFRFASYCMFAGKLGLLSLDEPTVYLDDQNVGRFCDLLQQIKRVAQGMNLQVILATHERSVMPFVDTVIDLNTSTTVKQ